MSLVTTPRTWVAGEIVTASEMNTEIRDALTGVQAAWTSYTPSWTASTTNPTIGNGTVVGKYLRLGKTVFFQILITVGSTTSAGSGSYSLSLPTGTALFSGPSCNGWVLDFSTSQVYPLVGLLGAFGLQGRQWSTTPGGPFLPFSAGGPVTLATSDNIAFNGVYEAI